MNKNIIILQLLKTASLMSIDEGIFVLRWAKGEVFCFID